MFNCSPYLNTDEISIFDLDGNGPQLCLSVLEKRAESRDRNIRKLWEHEIEGHTVTRVPTIAGDVGMHQMSNSHGLIGSNKHC